MSFSLHRRGKSPYYYAFFRTPDPKNPGKLKQHFLSTKQTRKDEAREKARALEQAKLREMSAGEEKSQAAYAVLSEACELTVKGHLTEAAASGYLSRLLEISSGRSLKTYSVREWFDVWLSDKKGETAPVTVRRYRGTANRFMAFLPEERVNGNLLHLSADDLRAFRDAELASGKTAGTVNLAIAAIGSALNKARRDQVIPSNPAESLDTLKTDRMEKATFAPADLQRLLSVAGEDWTGVILFGYYTGANLGDITKFCWSQIDLLADHLKYRRQKTGVAITLPLHSELTEWLLTRKAGDDPEAFVFPELAGESTGGKNGLSGTFKSLMKKAGLSGKEIKPGKTENGEKSKGRHRSTLTFHSLRHGFNSALANSGVPVEIRNKLTGHSSARMNENYTHMELETYRNAVKTVPAISEQINGGQSK